MIDKPIGESIGRRYRVLEILGRGGLGTVYKTLDTRRQRFVALKVFHSAHNPEAKQLFLREIDALGRLQHRNIVRIYGVGKTENLVYLAFEYIEGRTLGQIMAGANPLDPDVTAEFLTRDYAIEIIRQVGAGLAYAHQHGVVHRDVKPSNILISNAGRVLLADFGLAIAPGAPTLTQTGTVAGTPAYMSPEQVMGKPVDARTDIFSLGIVFYELLTGRKPFSGESAAKMFSSVVNEEPASLRQIDPSVPTSINEIVLRSLAKEPGQRFQTVDEFLRALAGTNLRPDQQEPVAIDETMPFGRDDFGTGVHDVPVAGEDESSLLSSPTGPLHSQRSDSRVTGRTGQAQPTILEQAVEQRGLGSQEATETGLLPYPPSPTSSAEALPHDPNAIAWLLILDRQGYGREIRLGDNVTLGRAAGNNIVFHDSRVSGHHARISLENGRFYISDLSSRHGTCVNRVRIEKHELRDRDEIELGTSGASRLLFVQAVSPADLTPETKQRLREFDEIWDQLTIRRAVANKGQFIALTRLIALGFLREAIGYRVESEIPYFRGTVGYMVEAPLLWIRHSRFPIIFIAFDQHRSDTLETVGKQLQIAKATEFFALLVVVPTTERTGREADEVRRLVADSVYRFDFVVLDRQSLASIIAHSSSRHLVEIILEQGIELSSLSPYVVKGPVPEKMFFGREKEIKTVTQGIQSGDYAIVGGRRIGKSSILQRVNRLLNNDPRYQPLYMDCEEKFNYEDLFQALADELGEPLEATDPLGFRRLVTRLKIRAPRRQVVFLLDEVDELLAFDAECKPAGQLFRTFRALSHEGLCRFVFSGSRTLYRHLQDPHSPFFNFCEDIALKPLEQKSIAEIVSKPMHQLGIELPEEEALIDRIIDMSSSHPNIAQWLCDRLIKTASARRITLNNLDNISTDPEFCRHYVQTAWSDSTPLEKLISLVVEGPSFEVDQLCEALARHGLSDRTMIRESLEMLQLCSLFEREGQRCRFALTHFPRMVRKMEDVTSQIECLLGQVAV